MFRLRIIIISHFKCYYLLIVFYYDVSSIKIDFFFVITFSTDMIEYNVSVNLLLLTSFLVTFITILKRELR